MPKKKINEGEKSPSTSKKRVNKTSDKEIREWDALYNYVKTAILGYDDNMNLPTYFVLRLKGMAQGKFVAKDRNKQNLTYGYPVILKTFEGKKPLIDYAFKHKHFNGESHKINWLCCLIESGINDTYLKMKEEKSETTQIRKENVNKEIGENIKRTTSLHTDGKLSMEEIINKKPETTWRKEDEDLW